MALCTTTWAPRSSGFWPSGVAKVESTTSSAPGAPAATAAMSVTSSVGFAGVSSQMTSAPSARASRLVASGAASRSTIRPDSCQLPSSARVPL